MALVTRPDALGLDLGLELMKVVRGVSEPFHALGLGLGVDLVESVRGVSDAFDASRLGFRSWFNGKRSWCS